MPAKNKKAVKPKSRITSNLRTVTVGEISLGNLNRNTIGDDAALADIDDTSYTAESIRLTSSGVVVADSGCDPVFVCMKDELPALIAALQELAKQ